MLLAAVLLLDGSASGSAEDACSSSCSFAGLQCKIGGAWGDWCSKGLFTTQERPIGPTFELQLFGDTYKLPLIW